MLSNVVAKAEDGIYKLEIYRHNDLDIDPEDPREWDNIGNMICFHNRYALGDKHDFEEQNDFFVSLIKDAISGRSDKPLPDELYINIANIALATLSSYDIGEVITNDVLNMVIGCIPDEKKIDIGKLIDDSDESSCFIEDALDDYDDDDLWKLLNDFDEYVILPLYLYDHSGLTMRTSPFSCPWDSGQVGWIYASKQRFRDETAYTDDELFGTDKHRTPKIGEHVKCEGYDDYGLVVSVESHGVFLVDFDYNKSPAFSNPERTVYFRQNQITEVAANWAKDMLIGEVKNYDMYLCGDVYGYQLFKLEKCPHCGNVESITEDGCGGFFADSREEIERQIKGNIPSEAEYLFEKLEWRD